MVHLLALRLFSNKGMPNMAESEPPPLSTVGMPSIDERGAGVPLRVFTPEDGKTGELVSVSTRQPKNLDSEAELSTSFGTPCT